MKRKLTEQERANLKSVRHGVYAFTHKLKNEPIQVTEVSYETSHKIIDELRNNVYWWIDRSWIFCGDVYFKFNGEWMLSMAYLPTETNPINQCGIYIATSDGKVYYSKY